MAQIETKKNNLIPKIEKSRVFVLVEPVTPRVQSLVCKCEIPDPRAGKGGMTTLRYIRGESSIFADEQNMTDKQLVESGKRVERMMFSDGAVIVKPRQLNLLKYIELCSNWVEGANFNSECSIRFRELNIAKQAKELVKDEITHAKAIVLIDTLSATKEGIQNLVSYAEVLGIETEDTHPETIIFELTKFAKAKPKEFMDGLNSQTLKDKWFVTKAVKLKYITINKTSKTVHSTSGAILFQAKPDTLEDDVIDEFTQWCGGKEGSGIFEAIKKYVSDKQ